MFQTKNITKISRVFGVLFLTFALMGCSTFRASSKKEKAEKKQVRIDDSVTRIIEDILIEIPQLSAIISDTAGNLTGKVTGKKVYKKPDKSKKDRQITVKINRTIDRTETSKVTTDSVVSTKEKQKNKNRFGISKFGGFMVVIGLVVGILVFIRIRKFF